MEDAPETISVFSNSDVVVLRSGKAKKTDPPIPADLAPLPGNGKRKRRFQEEPEEKPLLEPIRFRYSTEKVVEEPVEEIADPEDIQEETAETRSSRSRSRRRRHSENRDAAPKAEETPAPRQEKPKKEPKPAAEEPAAPEADQEKKPSRRRPNHRRRKPKTGPENGQGAN